jgi:hypothetical protein
MRDSVQRMQGARQTTGSANRTRWVMFATIYLPNFYLQAAIRHNRSCDSNLSRCSTIRKRNRHHSQLNQIAENAGVNNGMTQARAGAVFKVCGEDARARPGTIIGDQLPCLHLGRMSKPLRTRLHGPIYR